MRVSQMHGPSATGSRLRTVGTPFGSARGRRLTDSDPRGRPDVLA